MDTPTVDDYRSAREVLANLRSIYQSRVDDTVKQGLQDPGYAVGANAALVHAIDAVLALVDEYTGD